MQVKPWDPIRITHRGLAIVCARNSPDCIGVVSGRNVWDPTDHIDEIWVLLTGGAVPEDRKFMLETGLWFHEPPMPRANEELADALELYWSINNGHPGET